MKWACEKEIKRKSHKTVLRIKAFQLRLHFKVIRSIAKKYMQCEIYLLLPVCSVTESHIIVKSFNQSILQNNFQSFSSVTNTSHRQNIFTHSLIDQHCTQHHSKYTKTYQLESDKMEQFFSPKCVPISRFDCILSTRVSHKFLNA